jgi:hypothetical protein
MFSSRNNLEQLLRLVERAYQGTRVKTPARISRAASSAAATAQPSTDNNRPLREFNVTVVVLMYVLLGATLN